MDTDLGTLHNRESEFIAGARRVGNRDIDGAGRRIGGNREGGGDLTRAYDGEVRHRDTRSGIDGGSARKIRAGKNNVDARAGVSRSRVDRGERHTVARLQNGYGLVANRQGSGTGHSGEIL